MPGSDLAPAGDRGVLLLEGGLVLTLDDAGSAGPLSVAVEDGRIAAVGPGDALRRRFPAAGRVDCEGRVLLPGLVNAHLHPELQVLKGAVEELHLHDWEDAAHFDQALVLLSSPEGRWIQRAGIRAALADCLLTGTTCLATYGVTAASDEVAAEELVALRLRGHVTVRDVSFTPAERPGPPRIYRLHAEEALTPVELEAAARAHARGERLIMHAAETEQRLELVLERFGTTTVRLLERYGLLSPRMLLSHALYVDDEERALLARRGVPIISSPSAEMKLADGIAPIVDYVERGVPVALGTDSAVCNNSNDLFGEMRHLGLLQKLRFGADAMPAERILRMATADGARALGGWGEHGALVEGWSADLVLLDAHNPRLQPLVHRDGYSNVAANLVYAATGQDVTDVMVAGRWLVRDRRLLCADGPAIWEELARAASALYDRIL
ncbi:MAG: amidohydrolase family protein [Gemmatimonadetes bacterium]|nr:amidohydrolase family protein [Gemmatimonadota bacterium]